MNPETTPLLVDEEEDKLGFEEKEGATKSPLVHLWRPITLAHNIRKMYYIYPTIDEIISCTCEVKVD
jgi:hypothetical protein